MEMQMLLALIGFFCFASLIACGAIMITRLLLPERVTRRKQLRAEKKAEAERRAAEKIAAKEDARKAKAERKELEKRLAEQKRAERWGRAIPTLVEQPDPNEYILAESIPCNFRLFFTILALLCVPCLLGPAAYFLATGYLLRMGLLFLGLAAAYVGLIWLLFRLCTLLMSKQHLVVTNLRIYYRYFSHRLDLPLDTITAVGTNFFYSFVAAAPAGAIRLSFIRNNRELHKVITALLVARQHGDTLTPDDLVWRQPGETDEDEAVTV